MSELQQVGAIDPVAQDIVGVARFAALPDEPRVVDVAVTIGDRWQRRGLGTALLARLIDRATDEGHLALRASALAENTPSIAMLRRAGFVSRSGTGVLREFERAFTQPAGASRAPALTRRLQAARVARPLHGTAA